MKILPTLLHPARRRVALAVLATGALLVALPSQAETFSTGPQREAVDNASKELDKATEKATKTQQAAPTDAGQQKINSAEDAADAARDNANKANDVAEQARETAAEKANAAKAGDKEAIKKARDAEKAAKDAADAAKKADQTAKDSEAAAKKAEDDQVKEDKGQNQGRRIPHEARQAQRDAKKRLADRVRELQRAWADTKIDPKKKGVKITEAERRATEKAINEGRRDLGWPEIEILASRAELPPNTLSALISARQVQADLIGTGKTIGHIATLKLKNLTQEKISVAVPPLVLESKSGKTQHYVCPEGSTVALNPGEEKPVKQDGICVARSKPPVGNGVGGDLAINDGSGSPGSIFAPAQVEKLCNAVAAYYDGAGKLEKEGKLAKVPYKDPQMRKEIVTQWGVWSDPQICAITKEVPAKQEDLAKTVYRQTEEHTTVTPEIKKKLDTGITDIFASVQLTTKEAKDLEPPTAFAENSVPVSDGPPASSGESFPKTAERPPETPGTTVRPPGVTPAPRPAPEVPLEQVLADTIGALMNRGGLLQDTLEKNPELAAKVRRWLDARERMNRIARDRERRADAAKKAEKLREDARNLRTNARANPNPQARTSQEAAANAMDQGAADLEKQATITPDQRKEARETEKEFQKAQSEVPDYLKNEVDNALREQNAPPPAREGQERMEIGPDGNIIEPPQKK
jgi:hypothetical protein